MKHEEFNHLLGDILADMRLTLGSKAREYASNEDRLHNFKAAAKIDNETPERALWGMFKKHLISVVDMLAGIDRGFYYSMPSWREKLGDMRNYLVLLEALVMERNQNDFTGINRISEENPPLFSQPTSTDPGSLQGMY